MNIDNNKQSYLETPKIQHTFLNPLQKGTSLQTTQTDIFSQQNRNIPNSTSEQRILKILPNPKKIPTFFQETSPYRLIIGNTPLRSPYKDFRLRDLIETPPKNDLIFDNFRFDTSAESIYITSYNIIYIIEYDYSNNKSCYEIGIGRLIQGKKINFANESNNESEDEHIKTNNNNSNYINVVNNNFILNKQVSKKICCTCVKTECIKKYCACYASGHFCEGCECKNCLNTLEVFQKNHSNININVIKSNNNIDNNNNIISLNNENINNSNNSNSNNMSTIIINQNINPFNQNHLHNEVICNCTKSNCTKKYCECYKMGRNCNSLCRCVNCLNKITNCKDNSTSNNKFNSEYIDELHNENNYDKNEHSNVISKLNENTSSKGKTNEFQTEQFFNNIHLNSNNNVISHVNRNIQHDNIRNKARKICLSFRTDCIGIEINKKGMKIERRNLLFEDNDFKDKLRGKGKDKNGYVSQMSIEGNNVKKDNKRKKDNVILKEKNESGGNGKKIMEDIQTTPKMTKRKRSRYKNESTNMKTPSNGSTGKQSTNKRRLNLRDNRVTKKKLIL